MRAVDRSDPGVRKRLAAGLGLLAVAAVWELLGFRDAGRCDGPGAHDPNIAVAMMLFVPLLWLVAIGLLAWSRAARGYWLWTCVASVVIVGLGFIPAFARLGESCIA